MVDVAQIHCPHCRNSLRIPTAWAEQPMRCKFCQQVFLARKRPAARGNGHPVAAPALPATPRFASRGSSRGGFPLKAVLVGGLVFVSVGVATVIVALVLGTALDRMVNPGSLPQPEKVAAKKETPSGTATAKNPSPDTAKGAPKNETGKGPASSGKGPEKTGKSPPATSKNPPKTEKGPPATAKKPPDTAKDPPETVKPPVAQIVQEIVSELALLPPATGGKAAAIDPATLPAFPANVLNAYKADYRTILEFRDREAGFPLRAVIARTVQALNENVKGPNMRKVIDAKTLVDKQLAALKNQVKAEQENVAQRAQILKEMVKEMVENGEKYRGAETKRVQALYDYALLRLKARVVHVYEYNYNLALIRTDSLTPLEPGDKLYRLVSQEKVIINEGTIRQYVKDLKKGWTEIAKNYPDTPWAVLAPREQEVLLGLSWQPSKQ